MAETCPELWGGRWKLFFSPSPPKYEFWGDGIIFWVLSPLCFQYLAYRSLIKHPKLLRAHAIIVAQIGCCNKPSAYTFVYTGLLLLKTEIIQKQTCRHFCWDMNTLYAAYTRCISNIPIKFLHVLETWVGNKVWSVVSCDRFLGGYKILYPPHPNHWGGRSPPVPPKSPSMYRCCQWCKSLFETGGAWISWCS